LFGVEDFGLLECWERCWKQRVSLTPRALHTTPHTPNPKLLSPNPQTLHTKLQLLNPQPCEEKHNDKQNPKPHNPLTQPPTLKPHTPISNSQTLNQERRRTRRNRTSTTWTTSQARSPATSRHTLHYLSGFTPETGNLNL